MTALPKDFKKDTNLSGYKYVVRAGNGAGWQASRNGGARPGGWRGPLRASPEEAILDYCAYLNGGAVVPSVTLKSAGHKVLRKAIDRDEEVEAALGVLRDARAQRAGVQGYVYGITDGEYVKIGYSVNPPKRVAELQTGNARTLSLLGTIERAMHAKYQKINVLQEWFELDSALLDEFKEGQ